jgi:hypothetical protein
MERQMDEQLTFEVFLSHSAKDKAVVRALAERLREDGLRVWFDEWILRPSDSIPAKIEEGLERSRMLVHCISANTFGSEWAQWESRTFRFRDPLNKERRFLLLLLDDIPIKGFLAQFRYINWRPTGREQEYTKLLEACRPPAKRSVAEAGAAGEHVAKKITQLDYMNAYIRSYAFSLDGKLALTDGNETLRIWDVETGHHLRAFGPSAGFEASGTLALSRDNRLVLCAAAHHNNKVEVRNLEDGRSLHMLVGHKSGVLSVALSDDNQFALSAGFSELRLWNLNSETCLHKLEGHQGQIWSVVWCSDQQHALSGGAEDKTVRLWDLKTGQCRNVFRGHTSAVHCVAEGGDTQHLLSAGADELRLWDAETGRCLRVLARLIRGEAGECSVSL